MWVQFNSGSGKIGNKDGMRSMANSQKYYIIDAATLPDVFLRVAEAKRLLSTGEVKTVNEAARRTGISRSAFYKYRDAVLPFQSVMDGRVLTYQFILHDEPGALSRLLDVFATRGANIRTINSIVPSNGCAIVTISAETLDLTVQAEEFLSELRANRYVIKAEVVAD